MNVDDALRQKIVLSVQRALLASVTSNLRGVAADWNESEIRVYCYYHGPITEDDREVISCVHTEVATDHSREGGHIERVPLNPNSALDVAQAIKKL